MKPILLFLALLVLTCSSCRWMSYKRIKGNGNITTQDRKINFAEKIKLAEFIEVKGFKAKGNKLSYSKVKEINLLPPLEVHIEEDVLDEFEESGLSPLEAIKKAQEPAKEKNVISIDQMINAEIKLPSQEKKKKTSRLRSKGKDGGKDLKLDL